MQPSSHSWPIDCSKLFVISSKTCTVCIGNGPTVVVASRTLFGNKTDIGFDVLRFFNIVASVDLIFAGATIYF